MSKELNKEMENNTKNFEDLVPSSMKFTADGDLKLYDGTGAVMSQQHIVRSSTNKQKPNILKRFVKRIKLVIFALTHLDEIDNEFR